MAGRRKGRAKRGGKTGKRVRKVGKVEASLPRMPKPLRERVMQERPEKPEDVRVIEPPNGNGDPIVQVRGKTVGAWIDL